MKTLFTRFLCGAAILLLIPLTAFAQDGTVSGTVTDSETGDSLPGATVQIRELGIGSATDVDGNYEFDAPAGEYEITTSFVGYERARRTITIVGGETTTVDFGLAPSTAQLEEVTISAYRPQTDRVESGSAVSVSGEDIANSSIESAEGAMQGRAAGVRVNQQSGQPGSGFSVNVRGAVSVNAGTEPLYIVDGVQINKEDNLSFGNGNPLSSINPDDIESIQVLKDASAASIYGAQAANGVVLIQTKSGSPGQTQINFGMQFGTVNQLNNFDVMDSEQYVSFHAEALDNTIRTLTPLDSYEQFSGGQTSRAAAIAAYGDPSVNTDWPAALFQPGFSQTYNASVSGGNETTQFRLSGRFTEEEAQIFSSGFRSGQLRAKFDHQATSYLNLSSNLNVATNRYNGVNEAQVSVGSPFFAIFSQRPTRSIYNVPGDEDSGFNLFGGTFPNIIADQEFNTRESLVNSLTSSVSADVDLPKNFAARTLAGVQYEDIEEPLFLDPRLPSFQDEGGIGVYSTQRDITFNVSQSFSYENTFADAHRLSVLAGGEIRRTKENFGSLTGEQFPNELFRTLSSAADPTNVSQFTTQYRQQSVFGNASYTYDNTYQFSSTIRYDGNSRFGAENRYGLFGTVAGFWRISNESFLEDVDFLTNLKLRASYGVTGNSDIGDFTSRQQFSGQGEYNGLPGIRPTTIGNARLTWEEKASINIGLDYGLFNRRISGSVDVYQDNRRELLLSRDLPLDSGFGSILDNVGEIVVQGIDVSLSTVNVNDWNGFSWITDFNIAFQGYEVTKLLPDDDEIGTFTSYRVGEAPNQFNLGSYAGVNPANGRPMLYDANGELTYEDDPADYKLQGNSLPDFFGGFRNEFQYKGLTASAFVQFDYGRRAYANDQFFTDTGYFGFNKNADLLDRWQQPGDVTFVPKAYGSLIVGAISYPDGTNETTQSFSSTRFVQNASYVRLKEVQISYDIPPSLLGSIGGARSLRIFASGGNLLTFTDYKGPDPESVGSVTSTVFPVGRTYTAGLQLGL